MFYVYVLESENYTRYIGFTSDLKRRLVEHNTGKNRSTKHYDTWKVIYYEAHTNKEDAMRRERYFKTSPGRSALKKMLHEYYSTSGKDK